ncbi:unnamed protein product [Spodoptera littoralis]|uniref:Integrator complex subunit 1 R3 domain-containing protein n=1 Tax=Spodoptera littoralis TaxID=7109 RepID=A0A9P0HYR6_SPOLI|nr:unnamed protein product [Spodoptera littoralis]CAH1637957.1 unnamed protein product [Spodoptera littoralis]
MFHSGWSPSAVLDFAETLVESPRVWQGRDKTTPKHYVPDDTLRLNYQQLGVMVRYVAEEVRAVEREGGAEAARRRADARLRLLLRAAPAPQQLLAVAAAAQLHDPLLLLLLYMKVPKILPLVLQSGPRSRPLSLLPVAGAAASSTSATDRVSHALLTAIAAPAAHSKDYNQKLWRMEAEVRGLWARVGGAGSRALGLAAALLRGAGPQLRYHTHVLAALEVLPDHELFAPTNTADLHSILECFLALARSQPGGAASPLLHRVSAILRRYLACRPQLAGALLHQHKDTIA